MTDTYSSANSEQASSPSGMSEFGDDPSWNAPIQEGQSTTHSHSSSTTTADDTASSPNNNQQADSSSLSSDKDQHTAVRFETMVFRPTDHFSPATQNGTREPERIEAKRIWREAPEYAGIPLGIATEALRLGRELGEHIKTYDPYQGKLFDAAPIHFTRSIDAYWRQDKGIAERSGKLPKEQMVKMLMMAFAVGHEKSRLFLCTTPLVRQYAETVKEASASIDLRDTILQVQMVPGEPSQSHVMQYWPMVIGVRTTSHIVVLQASVWRENRETVIKASIEHVYTPAKFLHSCRPINMAINPFCRQEYAMMADNGYLALINWDSGELIAEKHTGSPGDNWRSCAFGPHPRILFFATPERVNILDLRRGNNAPLRPLYIAPLDSMIFALASAQDPSYECWITTTRNILCLDIRCPNQPIFKRLHHMENAPPTMLSVLVDKEGPERRKHLVAWSRHTEFAIHLDYAYPSGVVVTNTPITGDVATQQRLGLVRYHTLKFRRSYIHRFGKSIVLPMDGLALLFGRQNHGDDYRKKHGFFCFRYLEDGRVYMSWFVQVDDNKDKGIIHWQELSFGYPWLAEGDMMTDPGQVVMKNFPAFGYKRKEVLFHETSSLLHRMSKEIGDDREEFIEKRKESMLANWNPARIAKDIFYDHIPQLALRFQFRDCDEEVQREILKKLRELDHPATVRNLCGDILDRRGYTIRDMDQKIKDDVLYAVRLEHAKTILPDPKGEWLEKIVSSEKDDQKGNVFLRHGLSRTRKKLQMLMARDVIASGLVYFPNKLANDKLPYLGADINLTPTSKLLAKEWTPGEPHVPELSVLPPATATLDDSIEELFPMHGKKPREGREGPSNDIRPEEEEEMDIVPPVVTSSSQPTLDLDHSDHQSLRATLKRTAESSVDDDDDIPAIATQPVPGAFGSRKKEKKKKPRIKGFK